MSRLFGLNDEQWSKIEPLLPHYGSPPRVDDRRILSGIIHVLRCGCRWCDCPVDYGPYETCARVGVDGHVWRDRRAGRAEIGAACGLEGEALAAVAARPLRRPFRRLRGSSGSVSDCRRWR